MEDLSDALDLEEVINFLHNSMETCMTVENHLFEDAKNRLDYFYCYRRLLEFFEAIRKCIADGKPTA